MPKNRMELEGNMGKMPELTYTAAGRPMLCFDVCENRRYKTGEEWKTDSTWYACVAFGDLAENAAQMLSQGMQVLVQGRLQVKPYTGKDGVEREGRTLMADRICRVIPNRKKNGDTGFDRMGKEADEEEIPF